MSGPVSRRQFLAAGGGLTLAGLISACASPVLTSTTGGQPATADVIYWNLFGGGDGANMTLMVDAFEKASHLSVESTLLSWGNPYYTKLALAASSGRPPDVAISHLSRLPLLAEAGLLQPVEDAGIAASGITKDKFTPAAWAKATVQGTVYAVPLDTHPFVMFYNVDLARKAGLLNAAGDNLKPMKGRDDFVDALKAMKQASGQYGAISANTADPATTWRWFMTLYSGLAGPIVSDQGTRVTIDAAALEETFAFMQSLTGPLGLMPGNAADATVTTLFSEGKAGFLFDGEWQIPTYRGVKLPDGNRSPSTSCRSRPSSGPSRSLTPTPTRWSFPRTRAAPRNGRRTRSPSSRACWIAATSGLMADTFRRGGRYRPARRSSIRSRRATTSRPPSKRYTTHPAGTPARARTSRTPWAG